MLLAMQVIHPKGTLGNFFFPKVLRSTKAVQLTCFSIHKALTQQEIAKRR